MKITIIGHDKAKRYKIMLSSGGVIKKIYVPVGIAMPMTWKPENQPTPLRAGDCIGSICVDGGTEHKFSFPITKDGYAYRDDNIIISN